MSDFWLDLLPALAAALSALLMGVCGVRLLVRLTRVLRGQERVDALANDAPAGMPPVRALLLAALAALLSRAAVDLLAWGMMRAMGIPGGFSASLDALWNHWDTRHYIGIAQEGYTSVGDERLRLVFFPLYPLLMRLLSPLTGGSVFLAGMLISHLCAMGCAVLLYELAYRTYGAREARLAVAYFLLSPMSVFLNCCYTEALFLLLTLGAMVLLRRGHPWLAALCGMGSALTRMPGVIVAGLMLIALLAELPRRGPDVRRIAGCAGQMLLVFAGLLIYWAINWAVTGDPLMYMTYQKENWFQEPGTFWGSTANTAYYAITDFGQDDWFFSWGAQLAAMLAVYVLLALRADALPFDLAAYSFVYVAVVLSPTWLLSGPRYLYALAPLPLLLARMTESRRAHTVLLALSAVLLVVFTFGYTIAVDVL